MINKHCKMYILSSKPCKTGLLTPAMKKTTLMTKKKWMQLNEYFRKLVRSLVYKNQRSSLTSMKLMLK